MSIECQDFDAYYDSVTEKYILDQSVISELSCDLQVALKENAELKQQYDDSSAAHLKDLKEALVSAKIEAQKMCALVIENAKLEKRWEDFKAHVDSEVTTYTDKAMKNLCSTDAVEVIYNVWLKIEKMEELSKEKEG